MCETHTYTHTVSVCIYVYMYYTVCKCVCVCIYVCDYFIVYFIFAIPHFGKLTNNHFYYSIKYVFLYYRTPGIVKYRVLTQKNIPKRRYT